LSERSETGFLSVPREACRSVRPVAVGDGVTVPLYEIAGPADGPPLLWGHCNGFAGGSYLPFLQPLAESARVFTFDARGHGGSTWPEGDPAVLFAQARFADDLAAIGEAVARAAGMVPHYAAHSLNAVAALWLAARGEGPRWPSLTLFEPSVFPTPDVPEIAEAREKQARLVARTVARRSAWPSRADAAAYLRRRGVFAKFPPAFLAAHVSATTRETGGAVRLCSPPPVEAAIFRAHADDALWRVLPQIERPLTLVGGDPADADRDWVSAVMAPMAARMRQANLVTIEGAGHMVPFEAPERSCALVLAALR
jgi:pimeloyl-ACP methyl ester carboxylesterase